MDALDGLRGLAVLAVLGSHLSNIGMLPSPGLSGIGKSGVYLFFVLSAFLLVRGLLQRPLAGFANPWRWADYALRRVLRIWPLYLVVLLASWLLTRDGVLGWHYALDTPSLLRHLSLREGQSVLWSIPVEFTFYLWLPAAALALAAMQAWRWPWWAEAGAVALALAVATWRWPPAGTLVNDVRLGPYLVVFLCGAYAARIDRRLRTGALLRPRLWAAAGVLALVAWVITMPAVWAGITGAAFDQGLNHVWFVWFGLLWSTLLLAVLHGSGWLARPFAAAPLRLVGVVSFSLYLWHMPVLDAVHASLAGRWPALAPVMVMVVSLLVAMISFLLFERPWREIRLSRHRVAGGAGTAEANRSGGLREGI